MTSGSAQPGGGSWSDFASSRGGSSRPAPDDSGATAYQPPMGDPAATAYLPPIEESGFRPPPPLPLPAPAPSAMPRPAPARHALLGRFTVSLAGLLTAGCLVLGVLLAVLMFVVPPTGGAGVEASTGPGWTRTTWHLAAGAAGEVGLQIARRRSWPIRVAAAITVIIAVLLVLVLSWWR